MLLAFYWLLCQCCGVNWMGCYMQLLFPSSVIRMDHIYSPCSYITGWVFSNAWCAELKKASQLNSISILELTRKYLSGYIHITPFTPKGASSQTPQLSCDWNHGTLRGDHRKLCFKSITALISLAGIWLPRRCISSCDASQLMKAFRLIMELIVLYMQVTVWKCKLILQKSSFSLSFSLVMIISQKSQKEPEVIWANTSTQSRTDSEVVSITDVRSNCSGPELPCHLQGLIVCYWMSDGFITIYNFSDCFPLH